MARAWHFKIDETRHRVLGLENGEKWEILDQNYR